jgi:thiol:disulfide interchange protein DsbA
MFFRRTLALSAALLSLAFGAWAQAPYATLNPPQATDGGGKIEVVEFFWYGCPHCYSLEPEVAAWVKNAPKDVVFRRVPAYPSEAWGEGAKIYYTLEAMGLLDQYHPKVFDAIHKDNINLQNKGLRETWLKKNGIDVAKYEEAEKSFTVASKLARARQMTQSYKVDGVPRVVVNGKYYTSGEQAGGHQRVFAVVDQLVDMARRDSLATASAPAAAQPTAPPAKNAPPAKK